ncbi:hypothetical protein M2168_002760 [Streptomyces sp. CZ24]|nr:hypothetical protein [Streptomyces sp. CZ24]
MRSTLGAGGLHEVDAAALGRERQGVADPLVVVDELLDVEGRGGHAVAQGLVDRVAADDQLGGGALAGAGLGAAGLLLRLGVGEAVLHVPLARLGGRGRALALQAAASLAAAADLRALLTGHAAVVRGHEVYLFPSGTASDEAG